MKTNLQKIGLVLFSMPLVAKKILAIQYINNEGKGSQREIEPIGLTFYANQWHLIAWCWLRKSYRDFKIQQINQVVNKQKPFKKSKHLDINTYIKSIS
jgi:predicted DNA-binding transcriptional regulator YafY